MVQPNWGVHFPLSKTGIRYENFPKFELFISKIFHSVLWKAFTSWFMNGPLTWLLKAFFSFFLSFFLCFFLSLWAFVFGPTLGNDIFRLESTGGQWATKHERPANNHVIKLLWPRIYAHSQASKLTESASEPKKKKKNTERKNQSP